MKHINYTYTSILKPSVMALAVDLRGFAIDCTITIDCVIYQAHMLFPKLLNILKIPIK